MPALDLDPGHAAVNAYYEHLKQYEKVGARHEGAVRTAFRDLLTHGAGQMGWTLVPEWSHASKRIRIDGALLDDFRLTHGFWEAKDSDDDLDREIRRKLDKGYPTRNTLFQAPDRAVLMQDGGLVFDADLADPQKLVEVLRLFFGYREPAHEKWEEAVADFKDRVSEIGEALRALIERELQQNRRFHDAFETFFALCRQAVNPNLSRAAVEEMLIQHLLTERLFRTVFDNPDFVRRNVIAHEIEKVIDALTSRSFSRRDFLRRLDRFYKAIEQAADAAEDFAEKQAFLNTVYEQFFQGFAVDVADTHGIVYTPQPIVDFMTKSVAGLVETEFGAALDEEGVHVLDPFVGTGNFIVRLMQEIPTRRLPDKYGAPEDGKAEADAAPELHCNEVMLLPYYIASLNIEHAYYERIGEYAPFTGLCLVDTFGAEDQKQRPQLFSEANTERVKRQQSEKITVVLGNPPYNAWQVNANDNNRNRAYEHIDDRVRRTYVKDSSATLKNALYDPYVKAIRWATDRIGEQGLVAFVTNNSFIDSLAFDGMRKHLAEDFDAIYVLDCGGNVRKNPKLSGTTHNVFGIQVGVSINLFVKRPERSKQGVIPHPDAGSHQDWQSNRGRSRLGGRDDTSGEKGCEIHYHRLGESLRKEERYEVMDEAGDWRGIDWDVLEPDARHRWLVDPRVKEFEAFVPIGSKEDKAAKRGEAEAIFKTYSNGIKSNNDAFVYDFSQAQLEERARLMVKEFNAEHSRWISAGAPENVKSFIDVDETVLKWVRNTRRHLKRGSIAEFRGKEIRQATYRPFVSKHLLFNDMFCEDVYRIPSFLPDRESEKENCVIWLKVGSAWPVFGLAVNRIPDLLPQSGSQCFPFYVYDADGTNRRENVTGWALDRFRKHYGDASITKHDIFHYVYAVLHHPAYRERYAGNLKRQLPRVPFAPDFHAFAEAGRELAALHVGYESAEKYPLREAEAEGEKMQWRVGKMKFSKDKTALRYNAFLRLEGIPEEAHRYRLGHRSALEWLVDQYRVRRYKRYGITHDPNDPSDRWHIVRRVKQVTTVSLRTVEIVEALPALGLPEE